MNETCRLCGGSFARFKGYVIVPTPWGIEHEHKPGDCRVDNRPTTWEREHYDGCPAK